MIRSPPGESPRLGDACIGRPAKTVDIARRHWWLLQTDTSDAKTTTERGVMSGESARDSRPRAPNGDPIMANQQPFLTVSFAIALQGIFPSQN